MQGLQHSVEALPGDALKGTGVANPPTTRIDLLGSKIGIGKIERHDVFGGEHDVVGGAFRHRQNGADLLAGARQMHLAKLWIMQFAHLATRHQNGADDIDTFLRQLLDAGRSEEHTSELQSLMRISYAVFCLKKTKNRSPIKITSK